MNSMTPLGGSSPGGGPGDRAALVVAVGLAVVAVLLALAAVGFEPADIIALVQALAGVAPNA
jgi:hypothetical protein